MILLKSGIEFKLGLNLSSMYQRMNQKPDAKFWIITIEGIRKSIKMQTGLLKLPETTGIIKEEYDEKDAC